MSCARRSSAIFRARSLAFAFAIEAPPASDRFDLAWEAPAGCPDAASGRARVERFLGREVGRADDPQVRARVIVRSADGLFVAGIAIEGTDGERELSAERCDTVAEAAAYVVAAWIDPTVEPPALEDPAPEPAPIPTPPPVIEPRPEPAPKPRPRPVPRLRGALRLGAGVGVGPLPRVAATLLGGAALLLRRVRFELAVAHWLARPARRSDRPGTGGDIRLTSGAVRICPLAVVRPVEIPVCAGFEVGSMHGRGVGIEQIVSTRLLWAAFTAGVGLTWMPSRWVGPWVDATLVVPVSRPVFEAENVGRIHQPKAAGFAGMLGVEARFP